MVLPGDGWLENELCQPGLAYSFHVHEIRRRPLERLLDDPLLAPFAPLAAIVPAQRSIVLRRAFDLIATIADAELQLMLARATATLARLRLDAGTIS